MSPQTGVIIGLILLVGNAFFVAAEFAVLSARRASIETKAAHGDKRAATVLWAMEHVSLMLATSQLGVTVCSTGLGIIAEPAIAALIEPGLNAVGISDQLVHPIALVIALVLVVYLHVVLGEMVPKNLAVSHPDAAAMWVGRPLVLMARVLRPVVGALNWLANHVVRAVGMTPKDEVTSTFTAREVQSIVERSQEEGVLADDEGLFSGALEFSEHTAREVMVPLADLVTLPQDATAADLEAAVARTGFSRFPVLGPSGLPEGYLHVKDVLSVPDEAADRPFGVQRVRSFVDVEPQAEVEDILVAMQRTGAHLARVIDAGQAIGVVFLEDILEELVGEVRDAMQR